MPIEKLKLQLGLMQISHSITVKNITFLLKDERLLSFIRLLNKSLTEKHFLGLVGSFVVILVSINYITEMEELLFKTSRFMKIKFSQIHKLHKNVRHLKDQPDSS